MHENLSPRLFPLDPGIRYVAVNQEGAIVEMEQHMPSYNPPEADHTEELIVNPAVLELAKHRGDLDLGGIRYVVIRYGMLYQLIFPYRAGHCSVGVELKADVIGIAKKIGERLSLPL